MGGGGGQTVATGEIPPELRPLYSGISQQITATQNALPLSQFAQWNPGQVAGIAPMQQAALNAIPSTMQAPSGLQGLFGMIPGLNRAATGLYDVANQTGPLQGALDSLSASGRVGPMTLAQGPGSTSDFAASLPGAPSADLFPGAPPVPANVAQMPAPFSPTGGGPPMPGGGITPPQPSTIQIGQATPAPPSTNPFDPYAQRFLYNAYEQDPNNIWQHLDIRG